MFVEPPNTTATCVCDFTRSYFHFEIDVEKQPSITITKSQPLTLNHVRIPLESRCIVTEPSGEQAQYVFAASCKTELVNVPRDMWVQPNADFCIVASEDEFLILKRWDRHNKQLAQDSPELAAFAERQTGRTEDAWASHKLDVSMSEGTILPGATEIIEATLGNRHLVSRTTYRDERNRTILIEYPVKTINVSDRDGFYQVDTGPVVLPWGDGDGDIARFHRAFVAHNAGDWAEFIVNVPTRVTSDVSVHHYSHVFATDAENQIIELV